MNHHSPTVEVAYLNILAVTELWVRDTLVLLLLRCLKISSSLVAGRTASRATASFFDALADFFGMASRENPTIFLEGNEPGWL
jgi:Na+/H+ antiporter NhaA